ncbi:unnamed protein product [Phyllotreta striolata]|uniref:Uncharacterized protein n=1 Tax=Phyllotreta striolata TaxID=444603 RepID=A0A9N9XNY7_PHYSR|nr:unnamed protein product [Phyllotreta striolata]
MSKKLIKGVVKLGKIGAAVFLCVTGLEMIREC